jgi:hypothetical protein
VGDSSFELQQCNGDVPPTTLHKKAKNISLTKFVNTWEMGLCLLLGRVGCDSPNNRRLFLPFGLPSSFLHSVPEPHALMRLRISALYFDADPGHSIVPGGPCSVVDPHHLDAVSHKAFYFVTDPLTHLAGDLPFWQGRLPSNLSTETTDNCRYALSLPVRRPAPHNLLKTQHGTALEQSSCVQCDA